MGRVKKSFRQSLAGPFDFRANQQRTNPVADIHFFCSCGLFAFEMHTLGIDYGTTMASEGGDKTERFIAAARARAHAALDDKIPKLTALEKGMLESMQRGGRPVRHHRKLNG